MSGDGPTPPIPVADVLERGCHFCGGSGVHPDPWFDGAACPECATENEAAAKARSPHVGEDAG